MLRTIDPTQITQLLEGHEDILTPAIQEETRALERTRCPDCQSDKLQKELDKDRPFSEGALLPNYRLRCPECAGVFLPGSFLRLP